MVWIMHTWSRSKIHGLEHALMVQSKTPWFGACFHGQGVRSHGLEHALMVRSKTPWFGACFHGQGVRSNGSEHALMVWSRTPWFGACFHCQGVRSLLIFLQNPGGGKVPYIPQGGATPIPPRPLPWLGLWIYLKRLRQLNNPHSFNIYYKWFLADSSTCIPSIS